MKRLLAAVVGTSLALSLPGCGTICNLAGGVKHPDSEPRVYGGVLRDLEIAGEALDYSETPSNGHGMGGYVLLVGAVALGALDPILSFIGDTLTLPITIPLQNKRLATTAREEVHASEAAASPKPSDVLRVEPLPDVQPAGYQSPASGDK